MKTVAKETWARFAAEVLPANATIGWDYVRIEIWADSGRIIFFPASSKTNRRIEKAVCQVYLAELLKEYERLADSGMPDDEFTEQLTAYEGRLAEALLEGATGVPIVLPPDVSALKVSIRESDAEAPLLEGMV